MEFSRPEYWSGEPVPSPGDLRNPGIQPRSPAMQADSLPLSHKGSPSTPRTAVISSVKVKLLVTQSCLTLCGSVDCSPSGSSVPGILLARILEWVAVPFPKVFSQPRNLTQVSQIAGDSLPAEPQGKPKNTGVHSLSLLQGIASTQESNRGLLHYRQILYQLSC